MLLSLDRKWTRVERTDFLQVTPAGHLGSFLCGNSPPSLPAPTPTLQLSSMVLREPGPALPGWPSFPPAPPEHWFLRHQACLLPEEAVSASSAEKRSPWG